MIALRRQLNKDLSSENGKLQETGARQITQLLHYLSLLAIDYIVSNYPFSASRILLLTPQHLFHANNVVPFPFSSPSRKKESRKKPFTLHSTPISKSKRWLILNPHTPMNSTTAMRWLQTTSQHIHRNQPRRNHHEAHTWHPRSNHTTTSSTHQPNR